MARNNSENTKNANGVSRGGLLKRGWIKWLAGVLVLAGLLYVAFAPQPQHVDVATIQSGPLDVSVTAEGRTRIRDIFTISAPVNGRVLRVTLDPGDPVEAGKTVVAIFEPVQPDFLDERTLAESRARLEQAKATVIRAKAELDFAKVELERTEKLFANGHVSRNRLDQVKSTYDASKASHEAALAEQAAAQAALIVPEAEAVVPTGDDCCLRMASPVNGEILRVMQESERVMAAGSPILEVGNPGDLEIVVDLLSQDAVRVRAGQKVRIENWGGAEDLNGVVRRVEPSGFTKISALGVEEQRVNVIIDLTDPKSDWTGLRDAYRVEPRIIVWSADEVLLVPVSALFRADHETGEDWAVYRLIDDEAVLTPVDVGERNAVSAQILSGLAAGDVVVEYPGDDVSDGVWIKPRQSGANNGS